MQSVKEADTHCTISIRIEYIFYSCFPPSFSLDSVSKQNKYKKKKLKINIRNQNQEPVKYLWPTPWHKIYKRLYAQ